MSKPGTKVDSELAEKLIEANEQLVLALIQAQENADTAAGELSAASRAAESDALTALPGRVLLLDRLSHAIVSARRNGTRLAVLFLDLNSFKQINDTRGHAFGDEVLKLAAHCMTTSVREADTVCRYGGDEFVILLTELSHASDATLVAEKVIAHLGASHQIGNETLSLTASIGISLYPEDADEANVLIALADAAMYQAKRQGKGGFAFHGQVASAAATARGQLLTSQECLIAEREQRNVDLQQANAQLVLAAISAQELQASAELAQRRLTEFLALLAHELRNPLGPLLNATSLMGRVAPDELPKLQAVVERQVTHMARLIGDLLDTSRATTGTFRVHRTAIDLGRVLRQTTETCKPMVDARRQRLTLRLPMASLSVNGDAVRLSQVFVNLVNNASKYSSSGAEIVILVGVNASVVTITVRDNGIGIAPDVLETIFDPFVREPRAIAFHAGGLGIGLTVVRELVEAHGGHVRAGSGGAGLGSQFEVTLPLHVLPGATVSSAP